MQRQGSAIFIVGAKRERLSQCTKTKRSNVKNVAQISCSPLESRRSTQSAASRTNHNAAKLAATTAKTPPGDPENFSLPPAPVAETKPKSPSSQRPIAPSIAAIALQKSKRHSNVSSLTGAHFERRFILKNYQPMEVFPN
jgi:hypothetical protein